ncbi:MAG: glutathione peroxidase [Bacteroidales bacterium]|nr:glutathione peroxidase [Bacteroidales bacterium]MDD4823423.1 glutathione peroxidase [Bacteroidales bacterium]
MLPLVAANPVESFYSHKVKSLQGKEVALKMYKGKVVLVVNTASKCGYTPQYAGLEALYKKYKGEGLVILGFPCNQFGAQEPGTATEIAEFCTENYGVTFPMFEKIYVNGKDAAPLYVFLKKKLPGKKEEGDDVKWNFTKFLLDRKGNPVQRFAPAVKPAELETEIQRLLKMK